MRVRRGVFVSSFWTAAVLAGVLLLAGPLNVTVNAQQTAPAALAVKIDNFSFSPATLTVPEMMCGLSGAGAIPFALEGAKNRAFNR